MLSERALKFPFYALILCFFVLLAGDLSLCNLDNTALWDDEAEEGDFQQVLFHWPKALELNPDYALPHRNLAIHHENHDNNDKTHYHRIKNDKLSDSGETDRTQPFAEMKP